MPALAELQQEFRRALLEEDAAALSALIEGGPARLAVHRNNLFASLTDVLRDTFPAICRLVDARFFAYAAHEFIRRHPPERPVLAEYGARFADFIAGFAPCRDFPYLADVARLEWLMHRAAIAEESAPLAVAALAGVALEAAPLLRLTLQPSLRLIASPWPIDALWRANRRGGEGQVDLAAGGVRLQVSRSGEDVVMRPLDEACFAFRRALADGAALEAAAAAALALAADFALPRALGDLFAEGAVTDMVLP